MASSVPNPNFVDRLMDIVRPVLVPPHRQGYPFIGIAAALTLVISVFAPGFFFWGILITLYIVYFFRNPARIAPAGSGLVVAPGDGKVVDIAQVQTPANLGLEGARGWQRVSIFLSVLDVHVNRSPIQGVVQSVNYTRGKFHNAASPDATAKNESNSIVIQAEESQDVRVVMVQVAGLIARRIICDVDVGDDLKLGCEVGIIRFGSRVDLYVPAEVKILVSVGQMMIGGETRMGTFQASGVRQSKASAAAPEKSVKTEKSMPADKPKNQAGQANQTGGAVPSKAAEAAPPEPSEPPEPPDGGAKSDGGAKKESM